VCFHALCRYRSWWYFLVSVWISLHLTTKSSSIELVPESTCAPHPFADNARRVWYRSWTRPLFFTPYENIGLSCETNHYSQAAHDGGPYYPISETVESRVWLLGEQGAESIHALFNTLKRTYSTIPNAVSRLETILKEHLNQAVPQNIEKLPQKPRKPRAPKISNILHSQNDMLTYSGIYSVQKSLSCKNRVPSWRGMTTQQLVAHPTSRKTSWLLILIDLN